MVFTLGAFFLIESAEISVEVDGDVGGDEQSPAQIRRAAFAHAIVGSFKLA